MSLWDMFEIARVEHFTVTVEMVKDGKDKYFKSYVFDESGNRIGSSSICMKPEYAIEDAIRNANKKQKYLQSRKDLQS